MSALPRGKPFTKGIDERRTPGGRTKAQAAFSRSLREYIVKEGKVALTLDNGKKVSKIEAVVRAIYKEAITGNMQAVNFIAERVEGKVKDELDVTHKGGVQLFNHDVITGLLARRPSGDSEASGTD
jgi:hypothetical protein